MFVCTCALHQLADEGMTSCRYLDSRTVVKPMKSKGQNCQATLSQTNNIALRADIDTCHLLKNSTGGKLRLLYTHDRMKQTIVQIVDNDQRNNLVVRRKF